MQLVKTARGQLEAVMRMIEDDRYCVDISHQLLAAGALIKKANKNVIKAHLEGCVKDAIEEGNEERKTETLKEVYNLIDDLAK
jgi:DNA-binding FrmR family transcriptional regulator